MKRRTFVTGAMSSIPLLCVPRYLDGKEQALADRPSEIGWDSPRPDQASAMIKERWLEGEEAIKKDPQWAYEYAVDVIKGRWPEAEEVIKKDPGWAYSYAKEIIKGRWPEAEEVISKDPRWACEYAENVVNGKWSKLS